MEKPTKTFNKSIGINKKKTFWDRILAIKEWILGFGIIGVIIWWIVKILICIFAGICLL